jgi:hypothetical protein
MFTFCYGAVYLLLASPDNAVTVINTIKLVSSDTTRVSLYYIKLFYKNTYTSSYVVLQH